MKGDFEVDKEYHKDPSMRIVPLAVVEYFVNGTPVEETIRNHTDIFDFCLRLKLNSKTKGIFRHFNSDCEIVDSKLQRTTRYYISSDFKNSGSIIKDFGETSSGVNVGFQAIIFNKFEKKDIKDYKINYSFYIQEANKLKNAVSDGQLSLF